VGIAWRRFWPGNPTWVGGASHIRVGIDRPQCGHAVGWTARVREEEEDGDRAGIDRVTDLRFFSAIGRPVLLMYETNYGFFYLPMLLRNNKIASLIITKTIKHNNDSFVPSDEDTLQYSTKSKFFTSF
jgi:hypothetical protein